MGVSSDMRSSRVRRQAAKKPNKERTVQVRFSDEELAALDAICSEKKMTRSAFLRSCVEKVQGGDVEPTYVVTRNADAERMASEAKSIGVNVNQIARALNAETKSHPGSLSPGVLGERKGQFGIESFERVLGNRVADARDHASNMEEFLEELKVRGVELTETRKVDKETGEETVGWSYKSRDPYGKSRRKRRRRASNLADDLTREGIEAYFEAKQRELEAPEQDAPAPEVTPDVPETAEPAEQPSADSAIDVYDLDRAYVSEMASDLQKAHIHRSREEGKPFMDERYERLVEARNHPDEQLAKLREDVDAARREFHASKEARDTLQSPCPGLLAGMHVFVKAGCNARDPVSRMMADMTALMLRMMIQEALAEERRRQREEAEKRVYESRRSMWDAEKRLKAAEKALSNEDEREVHLKSERMQRRVKEAERRAPVRTPRSADKDTQFDE